MWCITDNGIEHLNSWREVWSVDDYKENMEDLLLQFRKPTAIKDLKHPTDRITYCEYDMNQILYLGLVREAESYIEDSRIQMTDIYVITPQGNQWLEEY